MPDVRGRDHPPEGVLNAAQLRSQRSADGGPVTFDEWVVAHADAITAAREASVAALGTEPGEIAAQLAHVRRYFVQMGMLLQDATSWVLKAHAVATQEARKLYGDYPADERKVMAKAAPAYLMALKLQGDIETTVSALKQMHFEILNGRRATFNPQAHNDD